MAGRAVAAMNSQVAGAIGRVLDVDPGVVRPDTPLADVGADAVALLAIVDALRESGALPAGYSDGVADLLRTARTAGDLLDAVEAATESNLQAAAPEAAAPEALT